MTEYPAPHGDDALSFDEAEAAGLDATLRDVAPSAVCQWCELAVVWSPRPADLAWPAFVHVANNMTACPTMRYCPSCAEPTVIQFDGLCVCGDPYPTN